MHKPPAQAKEKSSSNALLIGGGIAIIVMAIVAIILLNRSGPKAGPVSKAYYSEDDGKTYFAESIDRIPGAFNGPVGNVAVTAVVLRYSGEAPYVGWLESYTQRGQKLLADHYSDPAKRGTPPPYTAALDNEKLVKKPGQSGTWIGKNDPRFWQVQDMPRKNGEIPTRLMP